MADPNPDVIALALSHANALAGHIPYSDPGYPLANSFCYTQFFTYRYSVASYTDSDGYSQPYTYFNT